ncbi:MAG: transposase [Paludibacter sp.]
MISIPLSEYNELKTLIASLSEKIKFLIESNNSKDEKIKGLEEKINLLKNGRKSNTSSTPPSQDIGRSNKKNSRIKTGRKTGGQDDHPGYYLERKEIPDEIIDHKADYCSNCGADLRQVDSKLNGNESKQEVIIPSIQAQYLEHRSHSKTCPCCKAICKGVIPERLKAPIQYGSSVSTAVVYFSVVQYMPYKRIAITLRDIFHIPISEGTVDNMLDTSMEKAKPVYSIIQNKIGQSKIVGGDETGCRIANKTGWFFTWQNSSLTFIASSFSRGYKTIETYFKDGFPKAIYVSDCLPAQLKTPALHHQLCIAHLYFNWGKKRHFCYQKIGIPA